MRALAKASALILPALVLCLAPAGAEDAGRAAAAADPAVDPTIGFPTRVLPVLTKAGCNAGTCHGAATGQGGFALSLLGYDPEADYHAVTREFAGRRVDPSSPDQSLLLRKATRDLRHKGGLRIEAGSADHRTVVDWLAAGAPYGPPHRRVTSIDVRPPDVLLAGPDETVQVRVAATLSDGSAEDVTAHALYTPDDDAVAEASPGGAVRVKRRGTAAVMVRYGGQVAAVRVAVPHDNPELGADALPPENFVDRHVGAELRRLRVPPSPPCDDATFLRRASLDLTGRLPTAAEARAFLAAPSTPATRRRAIADLLGRPGFVDLWAMRLADLLRIDSKRLGEAPARAYHGWVREQVAANAPFDRVVRELLTAQGDGSQVGPANFHRLAQDPRDVGEYVSRAFLGVRIACARCHAHPFAAWTQDDHHRFAAYFARTRTDGTRVSVADHGEVRHPKTGRDLAPKPLGADLPGGAAPAGDRRAGLAGWVTSPDNPYFALAVANRVWGHMTGRGLVEPVDDLRPSNPASNPALLDALAADFAAGGYDLRRLVRTVAESRTYQLSSRATDANRHDDRLCSHARVRPLAAQVLADAVADATGVPDEHPGYPPGTRAVEMVDARTPSYALDVLGRCARDDDCDARTRGGGVSQALHLMNGSTTNGKLRGGAAGRLLREAASDAEIANELYLRTLSRLPTDDERTYVVATIRRAAKRAEAVEDLMWALLNSREFAYNH